MLRLMNTCNYHSYHRLQQNYLLHKLLQNNQMNQLLLKLIDIELINGKSVLHDYNLITIAGIQESVKIG